jgi:hypothetical protein
MRLTRRMLPGDPPGLGGEVLALAPGLYPPPTPMEENPAWQEVNRRLNVTFKFNIVTNPGDYPVKLATTMAGNDLPDLIYFQGGVDGVAHIPEFLQSRCADLTPYLAGDAAKDYPLSYNNINSARADFVAGKWIVYPEGFGNPWNDFWRRGLQRNPPVNFLALPPFPAHDGGKPTHFLSAGYLGATALKAASPDRIKELLRILNFLAVPFGTEEDLLLTSGLKDIDYHLDDKGNPVLTDRGNPDANYVPWKYVVQHPQVIYVPDIPNYAKTLSEAEQFLIPAGVSDPTLGYYSATSSSKGPVLNQAVGDALQEIIGGRRPLSDFDQVVSDWAANGGDQIRKEFEDAIAASK